MHLLSAHMHLLPAMRPQVCKAELNALLLGDTTPLYLAAQKGYTDVVEVLLLAGANHGTFFYLIDRCRQPN
jgi:hypothetical protein